MEKTAIIVTDEAESSRKMAKAIAAELEGFNVISVLAKDFAGTDLLPAALCFFGAENPEHPSFSYIFKMLQHINLADRSCGIFANTEEAAQYLCSMVHDSELALRADPFLGEGDIKAWVKKVISK